MILVSDRLRLWFAAAATGACAWLLGSSALANGRFPGADQLVIDPSDPQHLLVRATFGFVETRDGGSHWHWICEEAVGQIGTADPAIAITGDGTIVVAVPFEGVAVSHDSGCSWTRAPAPLAGQFAVDSTLEPNDPAGLLVLTSTNDPGPDVDAAFEFSNHVVETKDNARSWATVGVALPRDFVATTIEVAASAPDRIYVGGVVGIPPTAAIERSLDRGQTWSRSMVPATMAVAGLFVSAIDPREPDRLWVRVESPPIDAFGTTPTVLKMSADQGSTWNDITATRGAMLGFALSPDGTRVAYGSQEGVYTGPSEGGGSFEHASTIQDRGLTWSAAGLYACATDPIDPFAVGRSTDLGQSFEAIYRLRDTCPQECPDETSFNQTCRGPWVDPTSGVAALTGATGQACSVSWAGISKPGDAGSEGGTNIDEAGSTAPEAAAGGGCSCQASSGTATGALPIALFGALAMRLRRRRVRNSPTAAERIRASRRTRREAGCPRPVRSSRAT